MPGVLPTIGLGISAAATYARFQNLGLQVFPASAQCELQKALDGVKQSAGWLGLVSLGGLIWSASSIFATMEFALTEIFGTRQRDMLRQRLMGLVMMLLLVVALVLTVSVNAAAGYFPQGVAWMASFVAAAHAVVRPLPSPFPFVPHPTLPPP